MEGTQKYIRIIAGVMAAAFALLLCVYGLKTAISGGEPDAETLDYNNESDGSIIARSILLKEENFWGDGKRHVRVKNLSDYPAYVKVTPYFTARDGDGRICDCIINDESFLYLDLENWVKIGDSYYYSSPLEARKYTAFLVKDCRDTDANGNTVSVRFELQGIDAEDRRSVTERWRVEISDNGTIVG